MLPAALPEGSFKRVKDECQASGSGVLQATKGTEGTQPGAETEGKCLLKMPR